jgi:hypothetical protein
MTDRHAEQASSGDSLRRHALTPHGVALVSLWLVTAGGVTLMLIQGVRDTGEYSTLRYVLQISYVVALLWYLLLTGPRVNQVADTTPQDLSGRKYRVWLPVVAVGLVLAQTWSPKTAATSCFSSSWLRPCGSS